MKGQYEAKIAAIKSEVHTQYHQDLNAVKAKYEEIIAKQEQDLKAKDQKVKVLERQEKQQMMAKESSKGLEEQIRILTERVKNI